MALIWLLVSATAALAISAPIHIANTDGEGVFMRPEPNTSHPAVGWIPEGASPDYNCFVWGQVINGVPIWFNVSYNGKTGYYASYYDDSSYHSNEELTAKYGVPLCGSAPTASPPTAPTPSPASPSDGGGSDTPAGPSLFPRGLSSAFYSPNETAAGRSSLSAISSHDIPLGRWAPGYCSDSKVVAATPNGTGVLAGWSRGRLGPIYFLAAASAQRKAQVHAIILFDPGDSGDFAPPSLAQQLKDKILGIDPDVCDWQYPINSLLASWLSSNSGNRLVVLTGSASEEQKGGKSTYAGLWHYYFAGIWNKPFANQAQVCDYGGMGHDQVLEKFAGIVKNPPASCPPAPSGFKLTAWHP